MRDMIFVSMENWDDIWRRNQFLCAAFTRRFPGLRILFVGLSRDVSHAVRTRRFADLHRPVMRHPAGFPTITFCRPFKLLPTSLAVGRNVNDWLFRRTVRAAARRLRMHRPVLWLNPHYALHMAGHMGESQVIYDITDDWTELSQEPFLKTLTIAQDAALCRRADHVIVCSQHLYQAKRPLARHLHLIPNGVDAAHYRSVPDRREPLPEEARKWPKPVLGYTGTIHPDRVDVALVEQIARGLVQGSVVLLGPNLLTEPQRRRLEACKNIFSHPPVPYGQIPSYMRAFDVCITPHRVTPFTASLNPIKLWEYLAAGKPIIATPVAGFIDYPQHVYLAADAAGFLTAVSQALKEEPSRVAARQAEVTAHSWEARAEQIASLLAPPSSAPPPDSAESHSLEPLAHA